MFDKLKTAGIRLDMDYVERSNIRKISIVHETPPERMVCFKTLEIETAELRSDASTGSSDESDNYSSEDEELDDRLLALQHRIESAEEELRNLSHLLARKYRTHLFLSKMTTVFGHQRTEKIDQARVKFLHGLPHQNLDDVDLTRHGSKENSTTEPVTKFSVSTMGSRSTLEKPASLTHRRAAHVMKPTDLTHRRAAHAITSAPTIFGDGEQNV